jgi:hypothetical protein
LYFFIKCDIITELNISNIATASETFVRECDEWCSIAMRKCEVWSYQVLYCLKELRINECHLKIMTKSMFWCTLYMQSDKNINQEYFTETFHVIFWAYVKFSYNVTFYEKIQIWLSSTKFSYCRSIIVNWKKTSWHTYCILC